MAKLIQQVRKNSSGETPRYRVWNAINPPGNKDWCGLYTHCSRMDYYSVENPEEAYRLIKELIQEQLQDSEIFANALGWKNWKRVNISSGIHTSMVRTFGTPKNTAS